MAQCNLTSGLAVLCPGPPPGPGPGWPVSDTDNLFLGFVTRGQQLEPAQHSLDTAGRTIAADYAARFRAGERRLIKCRKYENSALDFILVSAVVRPVSDV